MPTTSTAQRVKKKMTKLRISWIDFAKVVCIWLMVCCHAGQRGLILDLTYQFHMPAFFIISGILFRPRGLKSDILLFGIPILIYGVVNFVYQIGFAFLQYGFNTEHIDWGGGVIYCKSMSWMKGFLLDSNVSVFPGYWFILTLMLMRLLMEVKWIRDNKIMIGSLLFLCCCFEPLLPFQETLVKMKPYNIVSCFPFFITGIILKETKFDVMKFSFEQKLLVAGLFFILTLIQGRVGIAEHNYGLSYCVFYLNALLGSILLFLLCHIATDNHKWLISFSNGTLLILGVHGLIWPSISFILNSVVAPETPSAYMPMLVGLITMTICYPMILFCERFLPIALGKQLHTYK